MRTTRIPTGIKGVGAIAQSTPFALEVFESTGDGTLYCVVMNT
jgi:hypothetical protein